ncbi:hypothetical protein L6452_19532 [Arctium lappa]|uniref:Uncharacterized protein n=1 Tax=Arctium lappa TaxID=4217 RepID=A0ACB9BAN5_ARCLA|nr:hypothetical protein L6452_19532 [Arctium lappa]
MVGTQRKIVRSELFKRFISGVVDGCHKCPLMISDDVTDLGKRAAQKREEKDLRQVSLSTLLLDGVELSSLSRLSKFTRPPIRPSLPLNKGKISHTTGVGAAGHSSVRI